MEEHIHHIEDAEFEMAVSDTAPPAIPESGSINTENANVTSFENIFQFLASHKYPNGLNLNQKRTLRKAAANFSLIGGKLYYISKSKKEKRLVILNDEGKRQVFRDCHGTEDSSSLASGNHWGQKKTLEKIESMFFWRGMVKDVVTWIQSCEYCQQKEEKRTSQLSKRLKSCSSGEDQNVVPILPQSSSPNSVDLIQAEDTSTMNRDIEAAKLCVEQIQALFNHIQYSQKEVIYQSNRAELDVDDVFDHLLSKFIKMISKKRREMKAQIELRRTKVLEILNNSRKQVEMKLKTARKTVSDLERTVRERREHTNISLPEVPRIEPVDGIWSAFDVERTSSELEAVVDNCGYVTDQLPYQISSALQLPSALRLTITNEKGFSSLRSLRLYHCYHDLSVIDPFELLNPNNLHTLEHTTGTETSYYLNALEPHKVYAIYLSYKEEGASDWSPWSFPFLASTPLPGFSWDATNGDWLTSSDQKKAGKIVSSLSPLYSSSAQFFPGCRIQFNIKEMSTVQEEDGFALIEQWVPGGKLCHDGTLFVNIRGQIYVCGKFIDTLDPLASESILTLDCDPRVEAVAEGLLLRFTVTCNQRSHSIEWIIRSQMTNLIQPLYFGMQFHHEGNQVKLD